jgi:hypothetical protein
MNTNSIKSYEEKNTILGRSLMVRDMVYNKFGEYRLSDGTHTQTDRQTDSVTISEADFLDEKVRKKVKCSRITHRIGETPL